MNAGGNLYGSRSPNSATWESGLRISKRGRISPPTSSASNSPTKANPIDATCGWTTGIIASCCMLTAATICSIWVFASQAQRNSRAMQRQLSEAGIKFRVGSEDEADERRVLEVLKLSDPDGNPVEIFHGPLVQFGKPFHPGRRDARAIQDRHGGLGHCIIRERTPMRPNAFITQLGMRGGVEYKIRMAASRHAGSRFMHCNDRDHTVAFGIPDRSPAQPHHDRGGQPRRRRHDL